MVCGTWAAELGGMQARVRILFRDHVGIWKSIPYANFRAYRQHLLPYVSIIAIVSLSKGFLPI